MKPYLLLSCLVLFLFSFADAQTKVQRLLCENKINPVGLDMAQPRFTWQLSSDKRGVFQTADEVRVAGEPASLQSGKNLVWNSNKVSSGQSVLVPYAGQPLQSGKKYYWQVRVWDNEGKASPWSEPAFWLTAFFHPGDWKAQWIGIGFTEEKENQPSPLFRKTFQAAKRFNLPPPLLQPSECMKRILTANEWVMPG